MKHTIEQIIGAKAESATFILESCLFPALSSASLNSIVGFHPLRNVIFLIMQSNTLNSIMKLTPPYLTLSFITLLICISSISVSAQETKQPDPKPIPKIERAIVLRQTVNGKPTYSYSFSDKEMANSPPWNQEENEPPLSVHKAIVIARQQLPRFVSDSEKLKVSRIGLSSIMGNKWFYTIDFACSDMECRSLPEKNFTIYVKMDGQIIEPIKEASQK